MTLPPFTHDQQPSLPLFRLGGLDEDTLQTAGGAAHLGDKELFSGQS
jgi:hypothetical protein